MEQTFSRISVMRIIVGLFGTVALLKQDVTRTYPGARSGNSKQDGLFSDNEIGGEPRVFTTPRYCLVKVPAGATPEAVAAKLNAHPNARLYRIISNNVTDCLTDEQKTMLARGQIRRPDGTFKTTEEAMEDYKNAYEVQDSAGVRYVDNAGHRQFRRNFFAVTAKEDIDKRTTPSATELPAEAAGSLITEGAAASSPLGAPLAR